MKISASWAFQILWILLLPSCNTYLSDVLIYEVSPFGVPAPRPAVEATGYKKWTGRVVPIEYIDGEVAKDESVLGIVELRPITGNYHLYNPFEGLIPLVDAKGNFVLRGAGHIEKSHSESIAGSLIKRNVKINGKSYDYVFVVLLRNLCGIGYGSSLAE